MSTDQTVIAFDLYGTLVTPKHAREKLISLYGNDKGSSVADRWRQYQLEYTWRLNSMNLYRPFDKLAKAALTHAVTESNLSLTSSDEDNLMKAFKSQQPFPDVVHALQVLQQTESISACIFSNGDRGLVDGILGGDGELQRYRGVWRGYITAGEETRFKPSRKIYDELVGGKTDGRGDRVWLVTANPFDVVGARAVGLRVAWVDRAGTGWVDGLGSMIGGIEPSIVVTGVDKAVEEIIKRASSDFKSK